MPGKIPTMSLREMRQPMIFPETTSLKFLRFFTPALLVACLLTCAACGGPAGGREPGTIYLHMGSEPGTLNPVIASDAYASDVNQYIYETLLEMDEDSLEMKPMLAKRWRVSPDGLRYRFYLKKGVLWSDGHEFTADDVIYSFKTIKDPKTANAHRKVNYLDIKDLRKIDKYTVEFIYSKKYFLGLRICGGMTIIPKHIFDDGTDINRHKNNRHPVGTGPYIFKKWITGSRLILERNERYRGKQPAIRRIVYKIVTEANVALQMLKKGQIDVLGVRAIQWVRQTNSEKFKNNFYKLEYYTPNYSYIGWNARRKPFDDRRVREAMGYLINREDILEKLLFGLGKRVAGTFYIKGDYYNHRLKPRPFDPARAAALLAKAGWKDTDGDGILDKGGKKFSFVFTISSGSKFSERLATIMKEDFSKAGILMEINRYEWAVFVQKLNKRDFDAVTLRWNLGFNEDPYDLWHSSQSAAGFNFVGFKNREADRIMERGRREFNEARRIKMFRRLEEILYREQPYTFFFCSPSLAVVSKRFDNVIVHTAGLDIKEWTFQQAR